MFPLKNGSMIGFDDQNVFQPVVSSNQFLNVFVALIAALLSVWIFVMLKELIYVQQGKKTETNFRFLFIFIFFQMVYVLAEGNQGRFDTKFSIEGFGDFVIGNYFFPFVLLFAFINGFRCKWIHYLNKNQKIGFFLFFTLVYPFALLLLLTSTNQVQSYSSVLNAFIKCIITIYTIYSGMSLIGILSLLPSAGLLDRRIQEIQSLQGLSGTIGSVLDRDELILRASELSRKVVNADFSWVELKDGADYHLVGTQGIHRETIVNVPEGIKETIRREGKRLDGAYLINDLSKNKQTREIKKWGRKIGSLLTARIRFKKKELGILYAAKRETFGFVEESRALFQAFADQVALALENANLVKVTIDQEVYREELRVAHEAQMRLLPQTMPNIEGIELDAYCATANEIGGDFYDIISVGDERFDIVVGDVSGKGASAAFYMAELKGVLQALAPHFSSPKKILVEVNGFLQNHFEPNTFVTMVYGILFPKKKQLCLVRAGHPPTGLVRQKNVSWIETRGVGLGLAANALFKKSLEEKTIHLKKGDTIFFYTDGLSEARNHEGEEYGEEVLTETLLDLHGQGAHEMLMAIRDRVDTFSHGVPRHDDVTLVALRMLK